jgi:kynurenine formamidase
LLFKPTNSNLWSSSTFEPNFVGIAEDAADVLVERGVGLVVSTIS